MAEGGNKQGVTPIPKDPKGSQRIPKDESPARALPGSSPAAEAMQVLPATPQAQFASLLRISHPIWPQMNPSCCFYSVLHLVTATSVSHRGWGRPASPALDRDRSWPGTGSGTGPCQPWDVSSLQRCIPVLGIPPSGSSSPGRAELHQSVSVQLPEKFNSRLALDVLRRPGQARPSRGR